MAQHSKSSDALVPLRKWIELESLAGFRIEDETNEKEVILRKTTIAYGLAELLMRTRTQHHCIDPSSLSLGVQFSIDNFVVRYSDVSSSSSSLAGSSATAGHVDFQPRWKDITGVDMLSPPILMNIGEPSFLRAVDSSNDDNGDGDDDRDVNEIVGRYLEVEFPTLPEAGTTSTLFAISQSEEDARCHSLGAILYELFSHRSPFPEEEGRGQQQQLRGENQQLGREEFFFMHDASPRELEHVRKKSRSQTSSHSPLFDLGLPSSVCLLVRNLLECGDENERRPEDAYDSLETVSKDLHLLLLDPNRFLFNHEQTTTSETNGGVQLLFRKHQLYGRENEVSLITDAFCRVSAGRSEAFFIGGFSGSGKSRLINSLTARVDINEGYVITHKFDQISKEMPLTGVISVFNDLCLLIGEKRSRKDLLVLADDLAECFGVDFPLLARLLPNVDLLVLADDLAECFGVDFPLLERLLPNGQAISSHRPSRVDCANESDGQMNLRSIRFVLRRFVKVVSSKSHPVMLFLDDLQWCDDSALALIEGILCDGGGCSHLFFVGSYRSNQVTDDHGIFHLMKSLRSSGVPTTRLDLEGLTPEDLNSMVSDAMGMFPRVCEPFSDIVFKKTKGNPFFVLEFLRSLVDGALLQYSVPSRRWVWDEDLICAMDITGNVLYLLVSKMIGLSENVQLALKTAACFGIKMQESVIQYLSTIPEYSSIQSGMECVIAEGFMVKVRTSEFKFVHDKVREAAYSLIPDIEKDQYHCSLGAKIYSISKGCNVDDIIFSIADQVNHGTAQSPELRLDFAQLNEMAGVKAVGCLDCVAAHSYLNNALTFLPSDHWKSHYEQSRRLCFLLAKSAYSCGDVEKAQGILQEILNQAHCLAGKLDAYHLVVSILYDRGKLGEAYATAHDVLVQLGEPISRAFSMQETNVMVETTSKMLIDLSEESLLGMKEMDRETQSLLKFYNILSITASLFKPHMAPFFSCRSVQLTMTRGISKYSLIGFVLYAAVGCGHDTVSVIQNASRIGKLATAALKRFDSPTDIVSSLYFVYYGFVASYSETVQTCADNLYRGFECGLACSDTTSGFINASHHVRISMAAGKHLPSLLKTVEHLLDVAKSHGNMMAILHLKLYLDTISILIGKGSSEYAIVQDAALKFPASLYHQAIRAFWIGHSERCHYLFEKGVKRTGNHSWGSRHNSGFEALYHGLNALKIMKRESLQQMKAAPRNALQLLKILSGCSQWNYRNKVQLLEAEILSYEGRNDEAKEAYASAIASAQCFRLVHEQGLACERAGFHFKKIKDRKSACDIFHQAKQCYAEWGSQMKVESITRQLDILQI